MRFYTLLLLPALLACSQPSAESSAAATTATLPTAGPAQAPAGAFPETFETGSKGAYETADVALATGPWLFTNGLIGSTDQDHKAGEHAARLRTGGRLTMQFDAPAGIRKISILSAAYGQDGPSTWELWVSRDHGRTWQRNGLPQTASGPTLRPALFAGLANEPLRLEIRKIDASKNRLNLDDIRLETSAGAVATVPASRPPTPAPTTTTPITKPPRPVPGPAAADNDNLLLGNPSGATSDPANATNYLLIHPQFATGYNAQRGLPVWTS